MKTFYLVDYENVASKGLAGCDSLGKSDHIIIFYTDSNKTIDLDVVAHHGKAKLKLRKVSGGNQILDYHICSYIGYLLGKHKIEKTRVVIVSNDKDYDKVIRFWQQEKNANVSRNLKINKSVDAAVKSTKPENTGVTSKVEKKKETSSSTSSSENVTKKEDLENEVREALKGKYDKTKVEKVVVITQGHYGKANLATNVHTELSRTFSDYSQIYKHLKAVLKKYDKVEVTVTSKTEAKADVKQRKTEINKEIHALLGSEGIAKKTIDHIASVASNNYGVKNGKQLTYRDIISKLGQKEGLRAYRIIKSIL